MKYAVTVLIGILGVVVVCGWYAFFRPNGEYRGVSNQEEFATQSIAARGVNKETEPQQSDRRQKESEELSPSQNVSDVGDGEMWYLLRNKGVVECAGTMDDMEIRQLLATLSVKNIEYSTERSDRAMSPSSDQVVSGFSGSSLCGIETVIRGEAHDLGDSWYKIFREQLISMGWSDEREQKVSIDQKMMQLFTVASDGALSHGTSFIHQPTKEEPYLQFVLIRESTLVAGQDDVEGFYCPCELDYYFFLTERYYIEEIKDHLELL